MVTSFTDSKNIPNISELSRLTNMTSRLKNHPSKHKKRVAIKNVIHLSQVLLTTKLSNVMQQIIGMACPIGVGANDEPNVIIC